MGLRLGGGGGGGAGGSNEIIYSSISRKKEISLVSSKFRLLGIKLVFILVPKSL